MSSSSNQIIEQLRCDGFICAQSALLLGISFALLAAWSLWRERHALGFPRLVAFWVLRVISFACALWMLTGPTLVSTDRNQSVQNVAIFADASASMDVVDPPDPFDSARWQ